ncbi:MAG: hydrogenase formation protein HypD [Chloroflexi bacterium CG15_BIG_FIL_POST_REV_8_21_14_020_46_15]|nr:MAG: hydrogenase formation protein HypD [Dehalococcoidia bacterium CG2_30_46_19]PIW39923.1 MAG: hydrogenase formation protein HypD [Chloroflexi bacterium CG15_BIG_FIL_POST_REV_8_21_14_020_46_15]
MKFIDEYQNSELAKGLVKRIAKQSTKTIKLMEFCGGHTHAIMRYGIRQLVPKTVEMRSGPGCPVCVTATADLDKAIALTHLPEVIITTFGDMMRVPGSYSSLQQAKAEGADVRIVYSVMDAIEIAEANPEKSVIFIGIGFETTAPTIAASILKAEQKKIENFYVLSLHKLTPPVMKTLLDSGEVKLDGIICPGHVSVIIGSHPYEFIPKNYGVACVISGFEPLDILLCLDKLVRQIENGQPRVEIAYPRGVKPEGNRKALQLMEEVFEIGEANWRGIGQVPQSGLKIRSKYEHFDADKAFSVTLKPAREPKGCRCGDVVRGAATPLECKLFRKVCSPERPIGPCMVSSEGACAAYYQYHG